MRQIICAAAAALMVMTLGCSPRDRRETASTLDSTAADIGRDVEQGAEEARDEFRDYAYDRRSEFRRDVDLKLKQLDEQIAELERTTKRGVDKARDSAVVRVTGARTAVSQNLDRFAGATEATWEEVKHDLTAAVDSLDREVKKLLPDARPMGGTGPS
jgi:molecular chaperone GrpE (heat shock protein)